MGRPVVHLIAHTHWDREWYQPLGGFRARLIPLIDDLLGRLARDAAFPSFYLDGQTVHLEDYLQLRPDQREAVVKLVRAGRLRTGPWYVLADEQIPSAESMVRNLALGRRDLRALGGTSGVLYSPDAFGHPASLPTLAAGFGLGEVLLWRGLHPEATGNRDRVRWRAPDGSEAAIYHLPADGYEIGSNLLVPEVKLADAWERVAAAVRPRAAGGHVAVLVGADHHAPDPALDSLAARLAAVDPNVEFRWSTLEAYLAAAQPAAGAALTGELRDSYGYTWTLQGVHGTRAPLKRQHAELEVLLSRIVEPLLVVAGGSPGHAAILRHAWRELVQCQFHDTLGGCADDTVARSMRERMTSVSHAASELTRSALHALAGHDPDSMRDGAPARPRLLVWNPVPRTRGGVLCAQATFFVEDILVGPPGTRRPQVGSGFEPFVLVDPAGHRLPVQLLHLSPSLERRDATRHYPDQDMVERAHFAVPLHAGLPGFSYSAFDFDPGEMPALEDFTGGHKNEIWNGHLRLAVDPDGSVTLAAVDEAVSCDGLLRLESERDEGDSYTFAPVPGDRPVTATRQGKVNLTAAGPYVASLQWAQRLTGGMDNHGKRGKVTMEVAAELRGDSSAVHCTIRLDNRAENQRLRLRFPLGLRKAAAVAGTHWGQVTRPQGVPTRKQRMETPVRTAPAHRWVALARKGRGLAVFAPGFFEYELTPNGDLLITLLRSIGELARADLLTRWGLAGWPTTIPEAQCPGSETIGLGMALITEEDLAAPERLEEMWEDLFLPPLAIWERDCTGHTAETGGIELTGEGLVHSACLPAEDGAGTVLRCYNTRDVAVQGAWRLAAPVSEAWRVRLDETVLAELRVSDGNRVTFTAAPREVVTIRVA